MVNAPSLHEHNNDGTDGHAGHVHGNGHDTSNGRPAYTHHADLEDRTAGQSPAQLLQGFLKAQATRAAISNELVGAFSEPDITDAALHKVVEISSVGLLEVRTQCEHVIAALQCHTQSAASDSALQSVLQDCTAIEALEKERIAEETKRLQLRRIARLNELAAEGQEADAENSAAPCIVEQRQKLESITAASQTSQSRVQNLVEQINDKLQEIREYVADNLEDD